MIFMGSVRIIYSGSTGICNIFSLSDKNKFLLFNCLVIFLQRNVSSHIAFLIFYHIIRTEFY